jgi:hypothetical protein
MQMGQVKYIGYPHFKDKGPLFDGAWVGVQLDHPAGNHNGTVDGVVYFVCKPRCGLFVRPDRVELIPENIEGPKFYYPQANTGVLLQFDVRKRAFKPFGFLHGDVVTPGAPDLKYRPVGTVIGVRGGVLWWHLEEMDGAVPCRNNAEELIEVFKRKKYKKIATKAPKNHDVEAAASRLVQSTLSPSTNMSLMHAGSKSNPMESFKDSVPMVSFLPTILVTAPSLGIDELYSNMGDGPEDGLISLSSHSGSNVSVSPRNRRVVPIIPHNPFGGLESSCVPPPPSQDIRQSGQTQNPLKRVF